MNNSSRLNAKYVVPSSVRSVCGAYPDRIILIEPSDRGEYELPEAVSRMLAGDERVETVEYDGWRLNVNTRDDIERAIGRLDR